MAVNLSRIILAALVLSGCAGPDAPTNFPGHTPGQPGLGAHALSFYRLGDPDHSTATSISTPAMAIEARGSTMVVSVGRGDIAAFALPTDSKGNAPYQQLDVTHNYTQYMGSGTALYAFPSATGGADFRISTSNKVSDEITLAAVEVIEGTRIQDHQWNEVVQPQSPVPVTSRSVTTTGAATLVAFWWGDAPEPGDKRATPNNGFTVVNSVLASGALVQCAVAVKNVSAAGTYNVTWTATPVQGAQLWLVAVE